MRKLHCIGNEERNNIDECIIPPIFHSIVKKKKKRYAEDYPSWDQALLDSTGYDSDIIVTKVKMLSLK